MLPAVFLSKVKNLTVARQDNRGFPGQLISITRVLTAPIRLQVLHHRTQEGHSVDLILLLIHSTTVVVELQYTTIGITVTLKRCGTFKQTRDLHLSHASRLAGGVHLHSMAVGRTNWLLLLLGLDATDKNMLL